MSAEIGKKPDRDEVAALVRQAVIEQAHSGGVARGPGTAWSACSKTAPSEDVRPVRRARIRQSRLSLAEESPRGDPVFAHRVELRSRPAEEREPIHAGLCAPEPAHPRGYQRPRPKATQVSRQDAAVGLWWSCILPERLARPIDNITPRVGERSMQVTARW
jgi:hypothetical protein